MAFPKTLAHRFLTMAKVRAAAAPAASAQASSLLRRLLPDSGEEPGLVRRILQRRPFFQSALPPVPPDRILGLPTGEKLIERIRWGGDRIRLDGLLPPPVVLAEAGSERKGITVEDVRKVPVVAEAGSEGKGMTVEDVKKVLRASQMEDARRKLREIPRSCVSYSEFLQICCEASSAERGPGIARSLDDSGAVIVLGDAVLLRPDQVAKAIQSMIPLRVPPQTDRQKQELLEMEEKKALIDKKAEALVKRELWCGLGLLVVQTAGFMRLTFWELSWDVMEPICFYVTSIYFMTGYAFFLRTSKEPSFEGFFESRFTTKQKRLMKAHNFDINRFKELKGGPSAPYSLEEQNTSPCNCSRRAPLLSASQ